MEDTEELALRRLTAVATHHGWTHEMTIWRMLNALAHQGDAFDFATFIWRIDNVASIETEMSEEFKPMLDVTLPRDREHDPLYAAFVRQSSSHE